jgi:hypothetical protein
MRPGSTPEYLAFVLHGTYATKPEARWPTGITAGDLYDSDRILCQQLRASCRAMGCDLFLATYVCHSKKIITRESPRLPRYGWRDADPDEYRDYNYYESEYASWPPQPADIVYSMKYSFGVIRDIGGEGLPRRVLKADKNTVLQSGPLNDIPTSGNRFVPVAIVVPDMHELILQYLDNRGNVGELVRYLMRTRSEREKTFSHPALIEVVCSKVIEEVETKLRKAKGTSEPPSVYHDVDRRLVPTLLACFKL